MNDTTTTTGQPAQVTVSAARLERLRQIRRALIGFLREVEREIAELEKTNSPG